MCNCNKVNNNIVKTFPELTNDCIYSLEYLQSLVDLINIHINHYTFSNEDIFFLQSQKGKILSGISLKNYCYDNYNLIESQIYETVYKYNS